MRDAGHPFRIIQEDLWSAEALAPTLLDASSAVTKAGLARTRCRMRPSLSAAEFSAGAERWKDEGSSQDLDLLSVARKRVCGFRSEERAIDRDQQVVVIAHSLARLAQAAKVQSCPPIRQKEMT